MDDRKDVASAIDRLRAERDRVQALEGAIRAGCEDCVLHGQDGGCDLCGWATAKALVGGAE